MASVFRPPLLSHHLCAARDTLMTNLSFDYSYKNFSHLGNLTLLLSLTDTLFRGANVSISLTQYFRQPLNCHFDLSFYPFDVHMCEMPLVLLPHETRHARLITGTNSAKFTGLKGLTDFEIEEFTIKLQDSQVSISRSPNTAPYRLYDAVFSNVNVVTDVAMTPDSLPWSRGTPHHLPVNDG